MTAPAVPAATFDDIRADTTAIVSEVRYATMSTVDRRGRPRTRVLIALWEFDGAEPIGWLGTFPTPVKVAHLQHNPHTTFSYWSGRQNTVALDSVATWVEDDETRDRVFTMHRTGSPRDVGYEPTRFWSGPDDPQFAVLRLEPWRIQVLRARDLSAGRPARLWRKPT